MIGHGFRSVTREVHPIGNWVLSVYFVLVKWFGGGLRAHVRTPKYFGILDFSASTWPGGVSSVLKP